MRWLGLATFLLLVGCAHAPGPGAPVASFGHDTPAPAAAGAPARLPPEQDPIVTDGDKYHLVLENEHVRVLHYKDTPGAKTHPHHHREFVLYALSSFRRRLTFPDGSTKERDFKPGDVIWMPEQTHVGENVGTTDTDVVIVEVLGRPAVEAR